MHPAVVARARCAGPTTGLASGQVSSAAAPSPVPVPASTEATRRRLSSRQALTVARLTEAAVEELRAVGYDGLTVRNVARRAGVAPATAYTYFTSKEHLVTEVFWRRLEALPDPAPDRRRAPARRVADALADMALSWPTSPSWPPPARWPCWPTTPT